MDCLSPAYGAHISLATDAVALSLSDRQLSFYETVTVCNPVSTSAIAAAQLLSAANPGRVTSSFSSGIIGASFRCCVSWEEVWPRLAQWPEGFGHRVQRRKKQVAMIEVCGRSRPQGSVHRLPPDDRHLSPSAKMKAAKCWRLGGHYSACWMILAAVAVIAISTAHADVQVRAPRALSIWPAFRFVSGSAACQGWWMNSTPGWMGMETPGNWISRAFDIYLMYGRELMLSPGR